MQVQRLLILTFVVLAMILAQRPRITEARRLIFYNPHTKPLTSQLLVSRRLTKPCPAGKMRDHRDRCRRAVIFGRST
ncbi:GM11346 [Drosophila sechellia]|uniref:GM11346 n=1 Tax=Drosophila sechellia TaxID=7238 RepID=B4IDJ7_DROSE|nr:GM11346 [Drosophila sechellia]